MFIRKVKTSSGATAVQIAERRYGRDLVKEHIGSAHNDTELTLLLKLANEKIHTNSNQIALFSLDQPDLTSKKDHSGSLGIGYPGPTSSLRLATISAKSVFLYQTLCKVYDRLGFSSLEDEVFMQLVIARLVEPTSKIDSLRVLKSLGATPPGKGKLYYSLPAINKLGYRDQLSDLCLKYVNPSSLSLVLYDVTTLYFESQKGDEFRKPGMSKERRLDPQIVVGLLVTRTGFPLAIKEFEGNFAETKTVIPLLQSYIRRYNIKNVTVAADAGMFSSSNLNALESVGLSYIVGSKIQKLPYGIQMFTTQNKTPADGEILDLDGKFLMGQQYQTRRVVYQYKEKRAKMDLKNIEDQVMKAERIANVEKNRLLKVVGAKKSLNTDLVEKYRARAGWKGYVTNLPREGEEQMSPLEIIHNYHQLFQVEKSFRMSKTDLKARPIYHRKLDSIRAHLTIVFAALAMARYIEERTRVSLKQFTQALRPIMTSTIQINDQVTEVDPFFPQDVEKLVADLLG